MKDKLSTEGLSKKVKGIKKKPRQERSILCNNSARKEDCKNEAVKSGLI